MIGKALTDALLAKNYQVIILSRGADKQPPPNNGCRKVCMGKGLRLTGTGHRAPARPTTPPPRPSVTPPTELVPVPDMPIPATPTTAAAVGGGFGKLIGKLLDKLTRLRLGPSRVVEFAS